MIWESRMIRSCSRLIAAIALAESVKDQLDPGRDSQLFEDPVEIVAYRMR